jgi:hypothetical protein
VKKALEAAVVAAALAIAFYVLHAWHARRELSARPRAAAPMGPGPDLENPDAPAPRERPKRGVVELPMVKLSRPPKPVREGAPVPPPSPAP